MNEEAKIHLSALESDLVNNTQWIFTKQIILKKVQFILGNLHDSYRKMVEQENEFLPGILKKPGGKITKGENYQGLPYLILDYPAYFTKKDIFAVRTMFWWGNYFSISLHVSGTYIPRPVHHLVEFAEKTDFLICINENQWHHHFQPDNYRTVQEMTQLEINDLSKKEFLKIGKKIDLTAWDSVPLFLEQNFREIIGFIKVSFPACEIVP